MQVLNGRGLGGMPQTLVTGADSLMRSGATLQDDNNNLPFWLFPKSQTQFKQITNSIPTPAAATLTEVLTFTVPAGFRFIFRGMRQEFNTGTGGGPIWVPGSGDILWTIDVNSPIGAPALSGFALPDLANMAEARGSQLGPWPVEGYNVFDEYMTLRYKVLTTANIPAGAPNFITCGLFGWMEKAV